MHKELRDTFGESPTFTGPLTTSSGGFDTEQNPEGILDDKETHISKVPSKKRNYRSVADRVFSMLKASEESAKKRDERLKGKREMEEE